MNLEAFKSEVGELLGVTSSRQPNLQEQARIEFLFLTICNKQVRKCNCRDRWHDALIEMYLELKKLQNINTQKVMTDYKVRHGCLVELNGDMYTGDIPTAVAKKFIKERLHNSQRLIDMWFEKYPAENEEPEQISAGKKKSKK